MINQMFLIVGLKQPYCQGNDCRNNRFSMLHLSKRHGKEMVGIKL
ncbi:Dihydroxyacid dehydratase/phosphogluconate dehydratase [Pseudomonas syringae pv. actinidiae]|uniref:Dihydroxyacid dehydratase/phosphogluconate dehydratase n=1 Tax=Pseudomonas syringae pv. actinidiae TaxID=103796 RepID=A0A2V0QF24_PSESF|nr:Dihydroxyacid dehydratase/phosphogluconate dehydratase [Pseudomonas syringae pv. actinidiae]